MTTDELIQEWRPQLSIEPTNICSAKCTFCWYGKGGDWRKPGLLSDGVFKKFIDLLGTSGQKTVSLSTDHGDVLCHPKMIGLVEALNRAGKWVEFYTNAILLHKHDLDRMFQCKIHQINISTYLGNPERYGQVFGVNAYRQMLCNIVRLAASPSRKFPVYIRMRCDMPFSTIKKTDDFQLIQRFVGKKRITWLDEWDDFNGMISEGDLPNGNHSLRPIAVDKKLVCYAMIRKFKILKDGEIVTCNCRLSKDFIVGHISDINNVDELIELPLWHKLIQNWEEGRLPKTCQGCSHYQPFTDLKKYSRISKIKFKLKLLKSKYTKHRGNG